MTSRPTSSSSTLTSVPGKPTHIPKQATAMISLHTPKHNPHQPPQPHQKANKSTSPGTSLNPRAPTIGLEAHLFFQSIGCGLPYDLDTGDIEVGPCLQARRGGLTWLIRSGELIWTLTTPQPNNCKIRFFQNQGCSGTSVLGDLFICRNNQPNGFWSFRVTC